MPCKERLRTRRYGLNLYRPCTAILATKVLKSRRTYRATRELPEIPLGSRDVVLPIAFATHHSKVAVRSLQWIGLEAIVDRRHTDCGFQLRTRFYAFEAILVSGIFVVDRFVTSFENQLEIHECRRTLSVHCPPPRRVDNLHIHHPEGCSSPVLAKLETFGRHRRYPVQAIRR